MSEKPPLPLGPMVGGMVAGVAGDWWRRAEPISARRRVREPA